MTVDELEGPAVAWAPPAGAFAASSAGRFAARHGIADPRELADRAAADPSWYRAAGVADLGIPWMRPYDTVVDLTRGVEHPAFFVGGTLNWADFAVDRWVREEHGGMRALWWEGDDGDRRSLTYAELKRDVDVAAGVLCSRGIGIGDVVALLLPMFPKRVVEAAAIGAPDDVKGEVLVCLVVLHDGVEPDAVVGELRGAVTAALGKAMAPRAVHAVDALPKTRNGTILCRVARASYLGSSQGDLSSLEDAGVLERWPRATPARVG